MNKKIGNDFEQELCNLLSDAGFWVHNFANRKNGQPADIIAVKDRLAYLIDAKVCSSDIFELRRIEENQHYAMQAWSACGNGTAYFALKFSDGSIHMVSYDVLKELIVIGYKQLKKKDMPKHGISLYQWMLIRGADVCRLK